MNKKLMFMVAAAFRSYYGENETGMIIGSDIVMPVAKYADDAAFKQVITSSAYLPRLQLVGGNSELGKTGQVKPGNYALISSKDQFEDLGTGFPVASLIWRFKALKIDSENIITIYNPHLSSFKEIQVTADTVPDSGCMYGTEFLVWIPSVAKFGTFFLSSKTARRQAPMLRSQLEARKNSTLKSELIKKGKHSWWGPVVVECTTPITVMPDPKELQEELNKFANPKESEVELASESTEGRER